MSQCQLTYVGKSGDGRHVYRCAKCGRTYTVAERDAARVRAMCSASPSEPVHYAIVAGPGTELAALFAEVGITEKVGCNCKAVAADMDRSGVAGCRERREYFLGELNKNADKYNWWDRIKAGGNLVRTGTVFSAGITLGGMFDEAVRRAESKVRVAFLTPSLLMGGAERWIASLVKHFGRSKIVPVGIFVSGTEPPSPIVLSWLPPKFPVIPAGQIPANATRFDCLIAWGHTDLGKHVAGLSVPVIEVQHGTMGFGEAQKRITDSAVAAATHLTAVGAACLDNFDPEVRPRVKIVENGAETERLAPKAGREATRAVLGIPESAKVALYIGRFATEKNLDGLAASVERLPPEWLLVAAGPQYNVAPRLKALGERLKLLEPHERLGDLLAAGDVFCAPSHHEANSLAVIEAMLAGIPVVTTDYPAVKLLDERHGQLGWRVPLQPSPEVLAGAIQAAYESGRGSPRVQHAQAVAREHYTAAAMTRRWERTILEACHAPLNSR